MDLARNPYYRYNSKLLIIIGQWPYQTSIRNHVHQFLVHLSIFSVILPQVIKMFESWGDVDIMIECFTPVGVQLIAVIKSVNCMINRRKIRLVADHMLNDWATLNNEIELAKLKTFAEGSRKISIIYSSFLFGSLIIYLLIPMMPSILNVVLPLNTSRQRTYLYQTEYFVDSETYFWWIALHTYFGTVLTICTVVSVDAMFFTYIHHVCGLLAIVSEKIEKTSEKINWAKFDLNIPLAEDDFYEELKCCIRKHQDAIDLAKLIASSFSSSLLFELVIVMVLLSVSLVQLLLKLGQYDEMYRIIQFNAAQFFHLFFNSWPGQKLIDSSVRFRESVYYSGWHGFSSRSRSLLKIIMAGAREPLKITAYNFYDLSMENFGSILQTSLSYFTVLASLR
ncbi:odorant receptor 13a-like [Venturia canescens]|uniref:odorant receptor 13a-like n=1 Tax=Venturia canescens TaxID=32260 RepID=UPI001C9D6467|nr:odorant receptor 13a-like [Venturia canescens]